MSNTRNVLTDPDKSVHTTGFVALAAPKPGSELFPTPMITPGEYRAPAPGRLIEVRVTGTVVHATAAEALAVEDAIACVPARVTSDNPSKHLVVLGEPDAVNRAKLYEAVEGEINSHIDAVANDAWPCKTAGESYGAWLLAGSDIMKRVEAFYTANVKAREAAKAASRVRSQIRFSQLLSKHGLCYGKVTTDQLDSISDDAFMELIAELWLTSKASLRGALLRSMAVDGDTFDAWCETLPEVRDLVLNTDADDDRYTIEDVISFARDPFVAPTSETLNTVSVNINKNSVKRLVDQINGRTVAQLAEDDVYDTSAWRREALGALCAETATTDDIEALSKVASRCPAAVLLMWVRCMAGGDAKCVSNMRAAIKAAKTAN